MANAAKRDWAEFVGTLTIHEDPPSFYLVTPFLQIRLNNEIKEAIAGRLLCES